MIAKILVAFVAFEHAAFMILEMFFWTKPFGLKTFGMTQQKADLSAELAMNQGLYNGFLAAGLAWSLVIADPAWSLKVAQFFLACVFVAGLYGAWSTHRPRIALIQALPAALALIFLG